jgi:hypothetical protein
MKKILLVLCILFFMGCHSKSDILDKVIATNIDMDNLYEHPDPGMYAWVGIKEDKVYFFRGYADTGRLEIYLLREVPMKSTQNWRVKQ